jgi:hypothetical protein
MTARELKEFLDTLPPEQLELTVYRHDYDTDYESIHEAAYRGVCKAPGSPWRGAPEGIYLA